MLEALEARQLLSATLVISEFMALNDSTLADEDGDFEDWIEIHNATAAPIDTAGWHLTDDAGNLTRWTLPSRVIAPGGYLIVFASGKNRAGATGTLHTSFGIAGGGEYLAIVKPDLSIAHEYAPEFPAQLDDVSYGVATAGSVPVTLIGEAAPAKALIPTSSALGTTWRNVSFDDSAWLSGATGIGYDRNTTYLPLINLDVRSEMDNENDTAYIRVPFELTATNFISLTLRVKYDDGFAAFINGQLVESVNAPATLAYNSSATARHNDSQALDFVDFDLTPHIDKLAIGQNVLAIHGLNQTSNRSDFLIVPELLATQSQELDLNDVQYFTTPTPGAANTAGASGRVEDTSFSIDRGFYTDPFNVEITTLTPGATIKYTLDGSTPSPTHGFTYVGPLTISTTTTLRAMAFKTGLLDTDVDTQTYIFISDVITQGNTPAGYPSTWSGIPADYEMDPQITGSAAYASLIDDALLAIPSFSVVTDIANLFDSSTGIYTNSTQSGPAWERPTSVELLLPDGTKGFAVNAGIQIQGGASRQADNSPKHSFRIVFKDEYGPSKLNYSVFGPDAAQEFDSLILRGEYNLSWIHANHTGGDQRAQAQYMRDQFIRDIHLAMNQPSPHGHWVHLYLNGIYWGMYNLVERPDDAFSESYLGGDKDDYDAINSGEAINGDLQAWNAMMALANGGLASASAYAAIQQYLDIDNLIDYMILNIWAGNADWDHHNWYASRKRDVDGRFRFYSWDAEHTLRDVNTNIVNEDNNNNPSRLYAKLRDNAEFRLRFADHLQRWFFNGGLLTPDALVARWMERAGEIDVAVIAESARWGDYRRDVHQRQGPFVLYTRDDYWLPEQQRLVNDYLPQRSAIVLQQFTAAGLFPATAAPQFSQHGGEIPAGFGLTITNLGGGDIYYTLDGSDPRLEGGAPGAGAILYTGAVTLDDSTQVKARVRNGANWSPLVDAIFVLDTPPPLRITELMYNPAPPTQAERDAGFDDGDLFEFVELRNIGTETLNLADVRFTDGIDFAFGDIDLLPGKYVLAVRNLAAFNFRYGSVVPPEAIIAGEYTTNFSDAGEHVTLVGRFDQVIHDFTYDDVWYPSTDEVGDSLTIVDETAPLSAWNDPTGWRPSSQTHGSPGAFDAGDTIGPRIVSVEISSGAWSSAFREHLTSQGLGADGFYRLPLGSSAQLDPLSWSGVNRIRVRFDESVQVEASDGTLEGLNVATYAPLTFVYDATTFTATWHLAAPLVADRLTMSITQVTDDAGNALDGEWTDEVSTQSGDGLPGGNFVFRFNALPGDVDRSGQVDSLDVDMVRASQFAAAGGAGYSVFSDVDGSGMLMSSDVIQVRNRLTDELPIEPSVGGSSAGVIEPRSQPVQVREEPAVTTIAVDSLPARAGSSDGTTTQSPGAQRETPWPSWSALFSFALRFDASRQASPPASARRPFDSFHFTLIFDSPRDDHAISSPRIVPVLLAKRSTSSPMRWSIDTNRFGNG